MNLYHNSIRFVRQYGLFFVASTFFLVAVVDLRAMQIPDQVPNYDIRSMKLLSEQYKTMEEHRLSILETQNVDTQKDILDLDRKLDDINGKIWMALVGLSGVLFEAAVRTFKRYKTS
jgi:hypothetical protein